VWVVTENDDLISLDALRGHVKQTLPAHCAPRHIHFVTEIPRTALGKPKRSVLVQALQNI
jgi:acyl-coenzyme A synthetase/AMP-(fatty) acid ligase